MNIDPPSHDRDPDDELLRRAKDQTDDPPPASPAPAAEPTRTETIAADEPVGAIPKRVGQYHIKRAIASGGMGTVYEAVQEKPRRTVAVKLMRAGIASRSALRRFEYESQLLARLRHPGIAQVYDAGTHRDGEVTVPYFAMEYIPNAQPLNEYAKEKKLSTRERIELFAHVCEAVHHGHQKGIIHRDLKPSNILVDSSGQVKIIDFGVARSTDSDMAITTLQTDVGQLIGTLQYMSPEQCAADPHDIDTRSDVYALGVVLYELLCERLPYEIKGTAIHEATRVIREQEPAKLSTISKGLRGDVETIALKALEKDRDRRYRSSAELADDLRRYLSNEAIVARPPSIVYQLRVFARRNKGLMFATAAVFVVLLAGMIVSTSLYLRAEQALDDSDSVVQFLSDMLASVDPGEEGKDVKVRSILDEASKTVGATFVDKPLIEARLRNTIGATYSGLGLLDAAEAHLSQSAAIFTRELGLRDSRTLSAAGNYAAVIGIRGNFSQAEARVRSNLKIMRRVLGEEHPRTLMSMQNLAASLKKQGRYAEAEELDRKTLEIRRRVLGEEHPRTLMSMNNLGLSLNNQGRYGEAEELHRKILEIKRRVLGEEHPDTLMSMSNLAASLNKQGRYAEAGELHRETLEIKRRVLGEEHPRTLMSMSSLANSLRDQGRYAEAEELDRKTLEIRRRVLGEEHPHTLSSLNNLANSLRDQGRYAEAEELYRQTVETGRRVWGHEHPHLAHPLVGLAEVLLKKGEPTEAQSLLQEALTIRQAALADDHPMVADAKSVLGECLTALGRFDEAEPLLLESYDKLEAAQGESGKETLDALKRTVKLYEAWDAADPNQGHAEKAAKYRAALSEQESAEPTDQKQPPSTDTEDDSSSPSDNPTDSGG